MLARDTITNVIVKSSLTKRFRRNTNPHKYAVLWSSKFYKTINHIMRNNDPHKIISQFKYSAYFIKAFIEYFYTHGSSANEIRKQTLKLYRGYDDQFKFSDTIRDFGFIATSKKNSVAKEFAGDKGEVIRMKTEYLPDTVPYVIIDENISEHLREEEVLLLPGTLYITTSKKCKYKPNMQLIDIYRNASMAGGGHNMIAADSAMDIELAGKIIVWYRAIQGRPVEIINWRNIPKSEKKLYKFFRYKVDRLDASYESILRLIPEYVDLVNKPNKSSAETKRMMSYMVFTAIYDPKAKIVETIRYGVFNEVFEEIFNTSRCGEVEQTIHDFFARWGSKNPESD